MSMDGGAILSRECSWPQQRREGMTEISFFVSGDAIPQVIRDKEVLEISTGYSHEFCELCH